MVSESESDITEVLKALNHEIRREIIRILHKKQLTPYSDFLETLNLPASSNVAYHLSLLARAHLIEKDPEGKYLLTPLGRRSALLLDLAMESKSSIFSDIYLGFSRLNPTEILLGAWWTFFFVLGFSLLQLLLPLGIICILIAICSIVLIVFRTRTLWTLLLINNFIWIFFVPKNKELLALIIATNVFSLILLIPGAEFFVDISPLNYILGWLLLLTSLILSIIYLYVTVGRKLPITFGREKGESSNIR